MIEAAAPPRTTGGLRGVLRQLALATPWLGQSYALTPIYTILLQVQVADAVTRGSQATAVGLATGVGGIFALVVPPIVGQWSDRVSSRFGRRRPFLVAGSVGMIAACLVLFSARTYPPLLIGFVAFVAFINVAGVATFGLVPDLVAGEETGQASGLLSGFTQFGAVASLLTLLFLSKAHNLRASYFPIIAVIVITVVPTLWAAAGEGRDPAPSRPRPTFRQFIAPLHSGDFGWAFFTRMMTVAGLWSVLPFLVYLFRDVEKIPNPDQFTEVFELIVTAVAVPLAIAGGLASDRFGRKRFVYASGLLFVITLLVFQVGQMPTILVLVLGVIYGLGYGCWGSVDWALGLDTLPDRKAAAAKDLGLYHVADSLPRVAVPLAAGFMVDALNRVTTDLGYRSIFVLAVIFYLLGTLFVSRIRSVR
ncbi:MAG TPA: MFS transporter [Candidatus Dormibacteraeota bacterium]